MEYYQQLNSYFTNQGYAPDAAAHLSTAAYFQAQRQAMQPAPNSEQALIQSFMTLNDGQKMQFVQSWLLQNPQYFMKDKAATS